ncbi:hypothetical protein QBK99_22215 [Corticibacterium sp. UT-5YL-CI-8]|nr:hypothetical protein [Tianweitania sp. UT-5YL-CI-8]
MREAQLRARIKRVEIDAEWSILSRRLNRAVVTELPQREAWQLAASWFVKALAQGEGKAGWENLEDAQVDLGQELLPANLEAHASAEIDRLLAGEGVRLEPGSAGLKWLDSYLRRGLVEIAHRKFRASFPSIAIRADLEFGPLLSTSTVQRVAKITVKKVIEDIQRDPTRGEMSAKTRLKREAQWQAIKEFFGEDTNMRETGRDQVRNFMDLLRRLPSNATKHFPEATIHEAAQLGAGL